MMIKRLRKTIGALIRAVLPLKWVLILRRPRLMSAEFSRLINKSYRLMELVRDPNNLDDEYWAQLLRKHGHILDKGLQRCDAKIGHSKDIYALAQEALRQIKSEPVLEDPSIIWVKKKMAEYEKLQEGKAPVANFQSVDTPLKYRDYLEAIKARRSVRSYLKKPVNIDVIEKIIEVVNWSPTSCNRQTAKVFVANNPELAKACLSTCAGGTAFGDYIPCFMSFCADWRAYLLPQEIWVPMVDVSLGTQNCCLIAHSLGLSITLLSWAQSTEQQERNLRELLKMPDHYCIVVNGVVGYPDRSADVPLRKSIDFTYVLRQEVPDVNGHKGYRHECSSNKPLCA